MTKKTKTKKVARVGGSKVVRRPRSTASKGGRGSTRILTPRLARSDNEMCAMPRDNITIRGWWMLTDGHRVTITRQNAGEMPTAQMTVPRHIFDACVDWYMTGVLTKPRKGPKK